jgi:cytochrome P450
MTSRTLPAVAPMPPRARGGLPWVGAGVRLLRDPTAFFRDTRAALGDTFVVDAFGHRLFCVFSAAGVRALYALAEDVASKGFADYLLLRHKVPDELFVGRRTFPHDLFGNQETEGYLDSIEEAVRLQLAELGEGGTFEIFATTRRLGHRVGLAAWAGIECASVGTLDRLIPLFDRLDASESFVRPSRGFFTWATRKRAERAAMHEIEAAIGEVLDARRRGGVRRGDFLDRITDAWSDVELEAKRLGIARDVMLIHMGSQSNLYAAMAWTLVNLLENPELMARVRAGDDGLLERCAQESIRMAQRSITLRRVIRDVDVDDGQQRYRVSKGAFVTTMLSTTNTTAAPGLDRFDADHYERRHLREVPGLAARELVSTFGHGRHSCPAQRFSISAIRISLRRLLDAYELDAEFRDARPLRAQIGGVARADRPCPVRYRRRAPRLRDRILAVQP